MYGVRYYLISDKHAEETGVGRVCEPVKECAHLVPALLPVDPLPTYAESVPVVCAVRLGERGVAKVRIGGEGEDYVKVIHVVIDTLHASEWYQTRAVCCRDTERGVTDEHTKPEMGRPCYDLVAFG